MKTLGIIPARYHASRLPGKPLVDIGGMTMIERVYRQAEATPGIDRLVVATDDARIAKVVTDFGGQALLTRADHPSGTDRCAEVVPILEARGERFDVVVNIQGDEPLIDPAQLEGVLLPFRSDSTVEIVSQYKRIVSEEALFNPNVVKVVFGEKGKALYFSRHPIPFCRGSMIHEWLEQGAYYRHVGLYAFRASTLPQLAHLPKGKLEALESLEQLRWLEHGYSIYLVETHLDSWGVDTEEDLERVRKILST